MNNNDVLSIRISESEKEYLQNIAKSFNLQKPNSEDFSYSKAIKILLEYCQNNEIYPNKNTQNPLKDLRKMIEQIHASIPHLIYHNNYQSLAASSKLEDELVIQIKQKTIDYLNNNFSGFQNISYKEVKFKINNIGLKTIPIEIGDSIWK